MALRRVTIPLCALTLAAALAGCSSGSGTHRAAATRVSSVPTTTPASTASTTIESTPASTTASTSPAAHGVPAFAHIVVAVLENHAYGRIVAAPDAPFLNSLATSGAVLTKSYAITHPSEPNYLALFSGSTQGLADDSCPHSYATPNLGSALLAAGKTFVGYSEDLPQAGYTGCHHDGYARKHNPWVNFGALPGSVNQPMTAFPSDYSALPTVAFVIPNLDNDMHDGSVAQGDRWLQSHLGGYAAWAAAHDSLLVVTADEDDHSDDNRIPTILTGAHVRPGSYDTRTDHYGVLRTILDSVGLAPFAAAQSATPVTGIWSG